MAQQSQLVTFPGELLLSIFALVEENRPTGDGFAEWHRDPAAVRTLQNLRLTCRRFHEIATTLLIPTIRVGFTRASIERFEKVCSHRLISQGVRVVQVELRQLDESKAVDFETFQSYMSEAIEDLLHRHWRYHEVLPRSTCEKTLDCEPKLRRARIVFATLMSLELPSMVGFKPPQEYIQRAKTDMNGAWYVYRSAVRFQKQLRGPAGRRDENGITVFAQRLALAMANMSGKRPRTIEFLDSPGIGVPPLNRMGEVSLDGADWSRSDFEIFYEPFLRPKNANKYHPECRPCPILYNHLFHIPRALQAANVQIVQGISVDVRHMPLDTDSDSAKTLFEALCFLNLKSFSLRSALKHFYPRDQGYLTTCLAVPTLGRVSLEGPRYGVLYEPALARRVTAAAALGITTCGNKNDARDWMDGNIPHPNARINLNLRRVHINGGVFRLKDLGELLQTLPRQGLDEFSICDARLVRDDDEVPGHPGYKRGFKIVGTRSWEKALDLLREGLVLRRPEGFRLRRVCRRVYRAFPGDTEVSADEFAGIWGEEPWRSDEERKHTLELVETRLGSEPLSPAEQYVTRLSDVNPIRAIWEVKEERMRVAEKERKELLSGAPFFGVSSLDYL